MTERHGSRLPASEGGIKPGMTPTQVDWGRCVGMLLAAVALTIALVQPAAAAPSFSGPDYTPPCPPVEKPIAGATTATSTSPTIGDTPVSTTPTNSISNIGGGPLFSSAGNFTFKAPPVVAASKLSDRTQLIAFVVNILLLLATVMFIVLIPIGGLIWLGSAGNEEKSTQARRLLLNAVIGLFLTLAAQAIGNIILRQFGVNYSFDEVITKITRPSGSTDGGATSVPPGSRSVRFRLVALSSSDGKLIPNLAFTLVGSRNSVVGSVTTGADGSSETTVVIPIEATTINVYRAGDQSASGTDTRLDTIIGSFTIDADYTSYGCVLVELNLTAALIPVTVELIPAANSTNGQPITVAISSFDEQERIPAQQIGPTGGSITAMLHPTTIYSVILTIPGYSTTFGTLTTPSFDAANKTVRVETRTRQF